MQLPDLLVIITYVIGLFVIGAVYGGKVRTSSDLFAAGGRSPWWVSGLSGFMTMFSAGTFVVWGGIAFKHGLVAVSINMCYGVAALLVGWTVAGLLLIAAFIAFSIAWTIPFWTVSSQKKSILERIDKLVPHLNEDQT